MTRGARHPNIRRMLDFLRRAGHFEKSRLRLIAWFIAALVSAGIPLAAQPTSVRDILARIDAKAMRDLLDAAREQPDVALTNIIPVADNKFRYVFVWPAENTMMTEDRVGRSFLERFVQFASAQRYLANGFCLTPDGMGFVSATYGGAKVNLAFRDIEVYRDFGWREKCAGKFVTSEDVEKQKRAAEAAARRALPLPPPPARDAPSDGLSPFLKGIQVPE